MKAAFIPESPEVIEARWEKKKKSIEQLANSIRRLRVNITRDLSSDNEKTFLTALAIAIMLKTAERVGNEDSAGNGHYGVTCFKKKHVTIIGNKVLLDYVGKAGMPQDKSFSDKRIAKALKKAIKNSPDSFVFTTTKGLRIKQGQVNSYLEEFLITSKGIRGYLANKFTIEKLEKIEPEDTDKKRKRQLNKILTQVAEKVGHKRSTLKKHYLIPELPDAFVDHSEIIDIKGMGYLEDGGAESGEKKLEGGSNIYQSVGLEGYLVGKGENPYIGKERLVKCSDKNMKCFVSDHNDYRFIYVADGKNVSVLHIDKIDGHYTVRNAYTLEDYRRRGYARKLYEEAAKQLGNLAFSSNLSAMGRGFKESVSRMKDGGADNSEKFSIFVKEKTTKNEIKNIISGKGKVSNGAAIQAASSFLRRNAGSDSESRSEKHYKKQEEERLKSYISQNNLWFNDSDLSAPDGEGAEQKVYIVDEKHVIKINDSIFYSSWEDYLNNLTLHNYFFPDTSYKLIGFTEQNSVLYAVVKQNFIEETEKTDLQAVKHFMIDNGFTNTKNNDYHNIELGIILEDLHEGNVLTKDGVLFFIDTVFYLSDSLKMKDGGADLDWHTGYFLEDLQAAGIKISEVDDYTIKAGSHTLQRINFLDSRYYLQTN